MKTDSFIRLIALSAIWGASFLFMRIAAPSLGPAFLAEGRVFFAALFLLALAFYFKKDRSVLRHWKHFTILGLFNSALPFFLFGAAANTLSTAELAVLNATAPIWAYLIGVTLRLESVTVKRIVGLLIGVCGVAILLGNPFTHHNQIKIMPIGLSLAAACSYGIATNYAKRAVKVDSFSNAYGSMWTACVLIVPALFFFPVRSAPTLDVLASVIALGVVCSGVAYLFYFRLITDIGATSALTVTFLIPVFGAIWGAVFLNESITVQRIVGMLVVITGTALVTEFKFALLKKNLRQNNNDAG